MPPKSPRLIPFHPSMLRTEPGHALAHRQRHTLGGTMGAPVRDPRLDAGVVQTGPGQAFALASEQRFDEYTKVPAIYVMRASLGSEDNAVESMSVNLRPEQFLLRRLTWRVTPLIVTVDFEGTEVTYPLLPPIAPLYDPAECLSLKWGDEFTKFIGGSGPAPAGLFGALMGEVNGFLDMTREILFSGKQTISAEVQRVVSVAPWTQAPAVTSLIYGTPAYQGVDVVSVADQIVEIQLHGIGLLPPGSNYSGGG